MIQIIVVIMVTGAARGQNYNHPDAGVCPVVQVTRYILRVVVRKHTFTIIVDNCVVFNSSSTINTYCTATFSFRQRKCLHANKSCVFTATAVEISRDNSMRS